MINKILLVWYMENDNFGDVLIYDTVSSRLLKDGYNVESHAVGDSFLRITEHANQCDFMLFAGGGIIERYIPEIIRKFEKVSGILKVPYGIIGLGMGNFDYSEYSSEIKAWVDQAMFFYVRDEATKNQLDMISKSSKVIFSADCVFANTSIDRYIQTTQGITREGHGVNLRDLPYKDITKDFDWEAVNFILKQVNCDIVIPDSSEDASKIFIECENKCLRKFTNLLPIEKVQVTVNEINKCAWIVAMRFHVVLVAALMGIPTIPIMYCPKVRYLAEQLGITELALEIDEYRNIPQKVDMLCGRREEYLINIKKNVNVMKEKAEAMFEEILRYLEKL